MDYDNLILIWSLLVQNKQFFFIIWAEADKKLLINKKEILKKLEFWPHDILLVIWKLVSVQIKVLNKINGSTNKRN